MFTPEAADAIAIDGRIIDQIGDCADGMVVDTDRKFSRSYAANGHAQSCLAMQNFRQREDD